MTLAELITRNNVLFEVNGSVETPVLAIAVGPPRVLRMLGKEFSKERVEEALPRLERDPKKANAYMMGLSEGDSEGFMYIPIQFYYRL